MAESVQEQGSSAGMTDISKEHGEAVGGRRDKMAGTDGVAQFHGVRRTPSGKYAAQIWVPSRRAKIFVGTFATAEEAAEAYDAAAVELHAVTQGGRRRRRRRGGQGVRRRRLVRTPGPSSAACTGRL
jgi:hypothetical protein